MTATLLRNDKVLVVGGIGAEIYDSETGQWNSTGKLITPRYEHIAVRLADGKVLVAGGVLAPPASAGVSYLDRFLTSAEIYDPDTGIWSSGGNLSVPRYGHTAHLLADGTVLVVGGGTVVRPTPNFETSIEYSSTEIYDPATGAWSSAGTMPSAHSRHASTVLANGNVLVTGGIDNHRTTTASALFDIRTRAWASTGNLFTPRSDPTVTLLPDGRVLVSGGSTNRGPDSAELYDPITGRWSETGSMTARRYSHTATLLPDGNVLVAGGNAGDEDYFTGEMTEWASAEIYDPAAGRWNATANMRAPRYSHTATLLANGKVLVAGGYSNSYWSNAAELYDVGLPLLTMNSTSYCVGGSWTLKLNSVERNASIHLVGTSNGTRWEIPNWRQTDDNGSFTETASLPQGSEGTHTLYVEVGGKVSNQVSFSVARCQIQLMLNSNEYCSGAPWNLRVGSDFPNAWMNLSGTTNGMFWEIANWRRTGPDGSFAEAGTFVPGSEGSHTMRVLIGAAQSNVFSFRVSRCGP